MGSGCPVPPPSKYPEQFRRDAVDLVRSSGRSLREVGQELGVNHETLRNWVNAAKTAEAAGRGRGEEPVSAEAYGLLAALARVPDPRGPRGVRYPLASLLAVAMCAVMAGASPLVAIGDWVDDLGRSDWGQLHPFESPPML
ncbi:transposase family protein [Micromonospora sp. NPDC005413]|uniref:transposase family protein n=1 Tax=Micromonospora sp. NPDC005413 TaxID=3154563 RepID=UPI0033A46441